MSSLVFVSVRSETLHSKASNPGWLAATNRRSGSNSKATFKPKEPLEKFETRAAGIRTRGFPSARQKKKPIRGEEDGLC